MIIKIFPTFSIICKIGLWPYFFKVPPRGHYFRVYHYTKFCVCFCWFEILCEIEENHFNKRLTNIHFLKWSKKSLVMARDGIPSDGKQMLENFPDFMLGAMAQQAAYRGTGEGRTRESCASCVSSCETDHLAHCQNELLRKRHQLHGAKWYPKKNIGMLILVFADLILNIFLLVLVKNSKIRHDSIRIF